MIFRTTAAIGAAALALAAMAFAAGPAAAQDAAIQPGDEAAEAIAERLGALLYTYDQVAWHGTDAFSADVQRSGIQTDWLRGFLVLPGEGGKLWAVFYGELDGDLVEAARYQVEGSEVVGGGLLEGAARVPLSPVGRRMAALRQAAFGVMSSERLGLCARSNPNTIVLPPEADGSIAVYVMTPMTSNESYPLGGHYRFVFGADDQLVSHRRFLNSCFNLPMAMPDAGEGNRPVGVFISHLLDPQPTEIHFFASRYVPMQLMVGTLDSGTMWTISDGHLTDSAPIPEQARRP